MTNYCTLSDARKEMNASDTINDAQLRRNIAQVSKRIDAVMGTPRRPYFAPYTEQRKYTIWTTRVDSWNNTFWMDDHILSLTTVTRSGTDITSNVEIYSADNRVADSLRITNRSTDWYGYCGSSCDVPPYTLLVTGIWGWHEDYDNAYDSVDTVQDAAGISASDTTITVADVDGEDLDGFTPRFSAGNLIKIEDELMDVLSTDTTLDTMTVRRGRNGTTAAIHANGAAISVYRVDERVRRIASRQSALLHARVGAFQVETLDGVGATTYPQDLLTELKNSLTEFQYG
jgi:hypothetical protein